MKKFLSVSIGALLLAASLSASAWWGGDRWGGYGYNDWPVWTPMYWMEEMSDVWDDDYYDDYWGGPYGGPWGGPWGGPYGGPGYYGAPYGGGYGAPYGGGYGAPYGGPGYYGEPYGGYAPAYPAAPVPAPAE